MKLSVTKKICHLIMTTLFSAALACDGLSFQTLIVEAQETEAIPLRHLIICVDGVGFSTIEKMRAEGHFRMFGPASRMIAPFPTVTNVAMTELLRPAGAQEAAGYEDSFFDAEGNCFRGGLLDRFRHGHFIHGTFRELFDYHPSAIKSGLGYAAPPLSTYLEALTDLIRLRQKFRASRAPVFFAYTGSTDSLAHLGGERLLRRLLVNLDETVTDIVRESKGQIEVTIFSDHGNDFRGYRRVSLKSALRRAGFRLEKRVRDERSVILPQFGLIGCAVLFTKEANEARLAEVVTKVRGVDFAAYERGGVAHVVGQSGAATIERHEERFRYVTTSGDPLELAPVARMLKAQGKADLRGFIADKDWFQVTRDGVRPDAVRRVYEGASNSVRHRANIIINFEDGYYSGSTTLDFFAFLQATHGNLGRGQSYGFVMNTHRSVPPYLRAGDVWQAIGSPLLNKSELHNIANGNLNHRDTEAQRNKAK